MNLIFQENNKPLTDYQADFDICDLSFIQGVCVEFLDSSQESSEKLELIRWLAGEDGVLRKERRGREEV